eukprot:10185399-Prorocentrum_lima.AAC.1
MQCPSSRSSSAPVIARPGSKRCLMARTSRQNFLPAGRQVDDQGTNSKPRSVGQSKLPGEAS